MSRAGSSLGSMSLASSPLMFSKIGGTTRSMYQALTHSYGSAPNAVVSWASVSAAVWWSCDEAVDERLIVGRQRAGRRR